MCFWLIWTILICQLSPTHFTFKMDTGILKYVWSYNSCIKTTWIIRSTRDEYAIKFQFPTALHFYEGVRFFTTFARTKFNGSESSSFSLKFAATTAELKYETSSHINFASVWWCWWLMWWENVCQLDKTKKSWYIN